MIKQLIFSLIVILLVNCDLLFWKNNDDNTTDNIENGYYVHNNVKATMFYIGEEASSDNGNIDNISSAWDDKWAVHFGGIDDPDNRNGYYPKDFTPKENPFYFALPYNDFDENGNKKSNLNKIIPWYNTSLGKDNVSACKNRWIKITYNGKSAYAQWEDVGPFGEDDVDYVFGTSKPKNSVNGAGLDVSPAVNDYLGLDGEANVSWVFVDEDNVPSGPWKNIVTKSQIYWE